MVMLHNAQWRGVCAEDSVPSNVPNTKTRGSTYPWINCYAEGVSVLPLTNTTTEQERR